MEWSDLMPTNPGALDCNSPILDNARHHTGWPVSEPIRDWPEPEGGFGFEPRSVRLARKVDNGIIQTTCFPPNRGPLWPGGPLDVNLTPPAVRTFETGAMRDVDETKIDPEACFSPEVLVAYARYVKICQIMPDGTRRQDDNWQKGMPLESYMKSGWRHYLDWWKGHRRWKNHNGGDISGRMDIATLILHGCFALMFNVQGYLHEYLKKNPET
jgi:hypothetical protein